MRWYPQPLFSRAMRTMSSVISVRCAHVPDRGGAGSRQTSARPACETSPGLSLPWRRRPPVRVLYVRDVCRGRLEWSAPDRSLEDGTADGLERFVSPRAGIHCAAGAANSPSQSPTLTGAPLGSSSSKRTIIRSLPSASSSFLTLRGIATQLTLESRYCLLSCAAVA